MPRHATCAKRMNNSQPRKENRRACQGPEVPLRGILTLYYIHDATDSTSRANAAGNIR